MKILTYLVFLLTAFSIQAADFGDCSGAVQTEWNEDGRAMKLLADFTYTDKDDKTWTATAGSPIDGASIPPRLWGFVGAPYSGLYRKASIVHDVECVRKKEGWREVHRMFHEAMRCAGVSKIHAYIMYTAVYHCGPRWGTDQGLRIFPCSDESIAEYVRRYKVYFRRNLNISLTEIENLDPTVLADISGSSPLDAFRGPGGALAVKEDFDGFTLVLSDFPVGSALPAPEHLPILESATRNLSKTPGLHIYVAGHADSFGPADLNLELSRSRATNIEHQMIQWGAEATTLSVKSYGENNPLASNSTVEGRKMNRRVEIRVDERLPGVEREE